jgi:hypothetical protein
MMQYNAPAGNAWLTGPGQPPFSVIPANTPLENDDGTA